MTTDIVPRIGSTWKHIKLATAVTSAGLAIAGSVALGAWHRNDGAATVPAAGPIARIEEPAATSLVVYYLVESPERAVRLGEAAINARAFENVPTSLQNVFLPTSETTQDFRARLDKTPSKLNYEVIDLRAP
jgi:hypothetical protein